MPLSPFDFLGTRRLSLRLLLAIGTCSLLLIVLAIGYQLYSEYRRDLANIEANLDFVDGSYVPAIAASAYQMDEAQIRLQLRGMLQMQDIVHARVREQLNQHTSNIVEGLARQQGVLVREFPLRHQEHQVGTLLVQVSLESVHARLKERAWSIALTNSLLLLPLALIILWVLQRMVNRHLVRMADYADTLQLDHLDQPLALQRTPRQTQSQDELDRLVAAINAMRLRIGEDMRHRQEVERELLLRTTLLECVLEARIDGICIVAEDQTCLFGNNHFRQIWQLDIDCAPGTPLQPLFARLTDQIQDPEPFRAAMDLVHRSPDLVIQGELTLRSGATFEYYSVPVKRSGEQRYGRLWSYRDISQRRELEEQLRQSRKLETLGSLAGGIAHDFNNVLSPIVGYTELAMNLLPLESPLQPYLDHILKSAGRATELTRQILAFSRKQVLEVQIIDLNALVLEYESMLRRLIGETIVVQTKLSSQPVLIRADRSQIEQVVLNMAINARDAMPDGGILTIETAAVHLDEHYAGHHAEVEPGDYIMLSISDTGTGIEEAIRDRIFEPFFTTKERGQGTGLGLATSFGIVKQHQGHLWVYSELGHGTTFKIYLPRASGAPAMLAATQPESLVPHGSGTILVVEDDTLVRELACESLLTYGYQVIAAEDPVQALKLAEQGGIDLLLTDVVMPKMNGRELYQQLSARLHGLKVLYMSGYTENVIADQGILYEGVDFIQKPFSVRTLVQKVQNALD